METKVEQLIKDRSFGSLNSEERLAVQEWCASEQEFQQMKLLLNETAFLASAMSIDPSPDIKKSLDAVFSAKHPGAHAGWSAQQAVTPTPAPVIPLYRKTWFRVAAVAVLFLGTIPFWQLADNDMKPQERPQIAKLETQKPAEEKEVQTAQPAAPTENSAVETGESTIQVSEALAEAEMAPVAVDDIDMDVEDVAIGAVSPAPASWNGTYYTSSGVVNLKADMLTSDKAGYTFSAVGRNADLDPYSNMASRNDGRAISLAEQPDDLLDLLVPAF